MTNANHESFDVLTFKLNEMEYAMDIKMVELVVVKYKMFKVPNSKNFVKGIINLKGEIISILDLEGIMAFERKSTPSNIVIAKVFNENKVGFLVDAVLEIVPVQPFEFTPMKIDSANYIKGAIIKNNRLISFLDLHDLSLE